MAQEIERKFLLGSDRWRKDVFQSIRMSQAYLGGDGVSVRVRLAGEEAWLNVKENRLGRSRQEFEYPVSVADARAMMALARAGRIDKTRHLVKVGDHTWEIDEFQGDNAGLVVAEIELDREDEVFQHPDWLGDEVTEDERYYNVRLCREPYNQWSAP